MVQYHVQRRLGESLLIVELGDDCVFPLRFLIRLLSIPFYI
jgi:hypothetical protein